MNDGEWAKNNPEQRQEYLNSMSVCIKPGHHRNVMLACSQTSVGTTALKSILKTLRSTMPHPFYMLNFVICFAFHRSFSPWAQFCWSQGYFHERHQSSLRTFLLVYFIVLQISIILPGRQSLREQFAYCMPGCPNKLRLPQILPYMILLVHVWCCIRARRRYASNRTGSIPSCSISLIPSKP